MKKGLFITFEGLDGSGKTTQIRLLEDYLKKKGFEVVTTFEPGGTAIGKKIRDILLDKNNLSISGKAETLLFQASRAELVSAVIAPALEQGKIVICDRFFDSTLVYQGIARGLGEKEIMDMSMWAADGLVPDITILLSAKVAKVEKRLKESSKDKDRIELEEEHFKEKLYKGYLGLAGRNKKRFEVINAEGSIKSIFSRVKEKVDRILESRDGIIRKP